MNNTLTDDEKSFLEEIRVFITNRQQGGQLNKNELDFLSEIKRNKIEVRPSNIEGNGVFTKDTFNAGDLIGLAHTNDQPSTVLGRFYNHSETPNAESIKVGNERFIKAIKKLRRGEEITVDYKKQPELEQPSDFKR